MASHPEAASWRDYAEHLQALDEPLKALVPSDWGPQEWAETYRQLSSGVSMAHMGLFLGDSEHPDIWPLVNQAYNFLAPNPDGVYYVAPVDAQGVYKLSGFRGTVRTTDVQIGTGTFFTRGGVVPGPNLASHSLDGLSLGTNGSFEVVLSAKRPSGHVGDWWELGDSASYLLFRQFAYDWISEVDGRFAIERLDRPAARPRQSPEKIAELLALVGPWARNWTALGLRWTSAYREKGFVNKVSVRSLVDVGGVDDQFYIEGQFELGPDEAIIYETEIPERCHYWNVQLTDLMWATLDYTNCQTSLNGHTARLDADGKFRAVISATDPGVPNWLDTMGYSAGTILGRWSRSDSAPVPIITKIRLDKLKQHLPSDTPSVSAEARGATLRIRRKGAQLRRRW